MSQYAYYHEATGFPGATTRDVPSTAGRFEGHGAGGLTQKDGGQEVPNTFC